MRSITTIALAVAASLPLAAQTAEIRPLSEDCEIALALSAAPAHLRADAGVYVLGTDGFERARPSTNGFNCLVERNHPDAIIPQCFDRTSEDANLAAILDAGKHWRSGKTFAEAGELRRTALENGDYPTPGHGIAYMISDYNYIYNAQAGVMLNVGPHLMFHAPNLTAEDVGADPAAARANRGLLSLNAAGPHGFMVSFIEKPSDSAEVVKACGSQLPDAAEMRAFPPQG